MPELANPVQQPQTVFACRFRHQLSRARGQVVKAPLHHDRQVAELVYIKDILAAASRRQKSTRPRRASAPGLVSNLK